MAKLAEPFLSPDIVLNELCNLCNKDCKKKDRVKFPTSESWEDFKKKSKSWSRIQIPIDDPLHNYGTLYSTIENLTEKDVEVYLKSEKCVAHSSCRVKFKTRLPRYEENFPVKGQSQNNSSIVPEAPLIDNQNQTVGPRIQRSHQSKHLCFVCNEVRPTDGNTYDQGGLFRCEWDTSRDTLLKSQEFHQLNPSNEFLKAAADRLQILLSGTSYDIFSVDVYYHHSCYRDFTRLKSVEAVKEDLHAQSKIDVLESFMLKLRIKVVRDKYAFLLSELLIDLKTISEEQGLPEPLFGNTRTLKRKIIERFPEEIDFFSSGKLFDCPCV